MFKTMTAAGEGMGRMQSMNGLDELLPLPGKGGKTTRNLPPSVGGTIISAFTQMLTEGLLSLAAASNQSSSISEESASPLVVEDKPAVDQTVKLKTAEDRQLPQPLANKDIKGNEEILPVAGEIAPNVISSLFTSAPFFLGAVPTTNEGGDDKVPPQNATEPVFEDRIALPLAAAVETIANQATVSAAVITRLEKEPVAAKQTTEPPALASRAGEMIGLAGMQRPEQRINKPENGVPAAIMMGIALTAAVENTTNQAGAAVETIANQATVSAAVITRLEKEPTAAKQTTEPPALASRAGEMIGLAVMQRPEQRINKPENGVPAAIMMGIALTAAVENTTNQAGAAVETIANQATVSAAVITRLEKEPTAAKQTTEPPALASRAGEMIGVAGMQHPTQRINKPENGVPAAIMMGIALTAAVENTTNQVGAAVETIANQATVSAAVITRTDKELATDIQTTETPATASREHEATLPRNSRGSLLSAALVEFMALNGDAKKESIMGDKGRPHTQSLFTALEIMDMNVNAVGASLSKGQDITVPTTSLLAQVAEQLPQAISKGSGRIRLSLEPDNLGKLDMDLVVRENRVQIVLTAESRPVQQTLQVHGEQLRDALQQQGLEVDGFNVFLQNGRQGQGDPASGGNPFWGEYSRTAADKPGTENDNVPATAIPFLRGQNPNKGAGGINIFI